MASAREVVVTPGGIRDGDPAVLAALVERRGNAVLAYCDAVCPAAEAQRAAAEAFARFRAAVAAAADVRALDPRALLLGATRHAAASLSVPPPPGRGLRRPRGAGASATCALVPGLLAARAGGELGAADQQRLADHLARHGACAALAAAQANAEARYAAPPERTVPVSALSEILAALADAAPVVTGAAHVIGDRPLGRSAGDGVAAGPPRAADDRSEDEDEDDTPTPPGREAGSGAIAPSSDIVAPGDRTDAGATPADDSVAAAVLPPGAKVSTAIPRRRGAPTGHVVPPGPLLRYVIPGIVILAALAAAARVSGVLEADPPSRPGVTTPAVPATSSVGAAPIATASRTRAAGELRAARMQRAASERRARATARRRSAAARAASAPVPPRRAASPAAPGAPAAPTRQPTPLDAGASRTAAPPARKATVSTAPKPSGPALPPSEAATPATTVSATGAASGTPDGPAAAPGFPATAPPAS